MTRCLERIRAGFFVGVALGLVFALTACSSGSAASSNDSATPLARPSSPARLAIVAPSNGDVIHGSTVRVHVRLSGARVVAATSLHVVPTEGHLHLSMDDQLVSMSLGLSTTIPDVRPGLHIVTVEFVGSDHLPFDPPVVARVTFQARA
jgi:hypothetical protein